MSHGFDRGRSRLRVPVFYALHAHGGGSIVMTNQASAYGFLSSNVRNGGHKLDLTPYTQVRMTMHVTVASASANTPRVRVRYALAVSSPPVVGDFTSFGTGATEVYCSMATAGIIDSGWLAITTAALTANTFLDVEQGGGDAAADPEVAAIYLSFR